MKAKSRVYTFLLNKYGVAVADKAMFNFSNKKAKYVQQGKQ
jgi:hypothetical protein